MVASLSPYLYISLPHSHCSVFHKFAVSACISVLPSAVIFPNPILPRHITIVYIGSALLPNRPCLHRYWPSIFFLYLSSILLGVSAVSCTSLSDSPPPTTTTTISSSDHLDHLPIPSQIRLLALSSCYADHQHCLLSPFLLSISVLEIKYPVQLVFNGMDPFTAPRHVTFSTRLRSVARSVHYATLVLHARSSAATSSGL